MVRLLGHQEIVQINKFLRLAGKSEKDTKGRCRKTLSQS